MDNIISSPELEREALAILLSDRTKSPKGIPEKLFSVSKNLKLLEAMRKLESLNENWGMADLITETGDYKTVVDLSETFLTTVEWDRIIDNLTSLSVMREANNLLNQLRSKAIDLTEYLDRVKNLTYAMRVPTKLSDVAKKYAEFIEMSIDEVSKSKPRIFPSGYEFFDRDNSGFMPGDFCVIAGRTGRGKSALMTNMAYNMALQNHKVYFISLEMSNENILHRVLARESGIDSRKFRTPHTFSIDDQSNIYVQLGKMEDLPFYIDDKAVNQMQAIESLIQSTSPDIVFIDYIQRIFTGSRKDNRASEIDYIANRLKTLAKIRECAIIVGAQINREGEKEFTAEEAPSLRHLKWGGGIEEAADQVIIIDLEKRTFDEMKKKMPAQFTVWIEKNRMGSNAGPFTLDFYLETQTIQERTIRFTEMGTYDVEK